MDEDEEDTIMRTVAWGGGAGNKGRNMAKSKKKERREERENRTPGGDSIMGARLLCYKTDPGTLPHRLPSPSYALVISGVKRKCCRCCAPGGA